VSATRRLAAKVDGNVRANSIAQTSIHEYGWPRTLIKDRSSSSDSNSPVVGWTTDLIINRARPVSMAMNEAAFTRHVSQ
jgi:hypothetical protein